MPNESDSNLSNHPSELSEDSSSDIPTLDAGTPLSNRVLAGSVASFDTSEGKNHEEEAEKNGIQTEHKEKLEKARESIQEVSGNNSFLTSNRGDTTRRKETPDAQENGVGPQDGIHGSEAANIQPTPPIVSQEYRNSTTVEVVHGPERESELKGASVEQTAADMDSKSGSDGDWTSTPKRSTSNEENMYKIDEDRLLVRTYFHDMLKYINNHDATLANDKDGDLAFFIKQMPKEEMEIPFSQWILRKKEAVKREFQENVQGKLRKLRNEFNRVIENVEAIEDEKILIDLAEKLGLPR